jgi:ABC-type iron transport system FetAB ATPase subunit
MLFLKQLKQSIPCSQSVNICLSVDRTPFGELIEDPGEGKPYLTNNRCQPQAECTIHWIGNTVIEEKPENYKSHYNYCPVGS